LKGGWIPRHPRWFNHPAAKADDKAMNGRSRNFVDEAAAFVDFSGGWRLYEPFSNEG
jgi:hypothetical protein